MKKAIKILLVEDNPGDARSIREMLNDTDNTHYDIFQTTRLDEGIKILIKDHFDLILLICVFPIVKEWTPLIL